MLNELLSGAVAAFTMLSYILGIEVYVAEFFLAEGLRLIIEMRRTRIARLATRYNRFCA